MGLPRVCLPVARPSFRATCSVHVGLLVVELVDHDSCVALHSCPPRLMSGWPKLFWFLAISNPCLLFGLWPVVFVLLWSLPSGSK